MRLVTTEELEAQGLDKHIRLINKDWNEPDKFTVYYNYVVNLYGLTYVLTTSSMQYYVDEDYNLGGHSHSVSIAIYDIQQVLCAVHIINPKDGSVEYSTASRA